MIRSYEGNLKANNCVKKYIFNRKAEVRSLNRDRRNPGAIDG